MNSDLRDRLIRLICTGLPGPNKCVAPKCECYAQNGIPIAKAIDDLLREYVGESIAVPRKLLVEFMATADNVISGYDTAVQDRCISEKESDDAYSQLGPMEALMGWLRAHGISPESK